MEGHGGRASLLRLDKLKGGTEILTIPLAATGQNKNVFRAQATALLEDLAGIIPKQDGPLRATLEEVRDLVEQNATFISTFGSGANLGRR